MTAPVLALILANLVPAAGLLFFGWHLFDLLAVYWSENVIIGGFMLLRIAASPKIPIGGKLFLLPFFATHYGLFCFVHGVFLVAIFGDGSAPADFYRAPAHLLATAAGEGYGLGLVALAGSHAVSFVQNYLRRERQIAAPNPFAPYGRVIAMHLVVMAGALLTLGFDAGPLFTTLLVAAKIAVDVATHRAEHRLRSAPATAPTEPPDSEPEPPDDDYVAIE
ncbi:MAG: hypothetical protein KDE27_22925 [Planctomycetes bacterium]|nr:hypothetical protein [Planctomycetota bacterium]